MATKERLAAMAASLCAVCSGSMVIKLVEADPSDGASELRTYVCAERGHRRTYSVAAGNNYYRMAGIFVGAPGDYLGMTVDVVVTSAQRVGSIFQSDASRCGAPSFVVI